MIIYQQDHHQHRLSPLLSGPPILVPLLSNNLKKEMVSLSQFLQFAKSLYSRKTGFTKLVHTHHLLQLGFTRRDASLCSASQDL